MSHNTLTDLKLPKKSGEKISLGQLHGAANGLAIALAAKQHNKTFLVICEDMLRAQSLLQEVQFFDPSIKARIFPDWETLPYDSFSPHQDIISERLKTLVSTAAMPPSAHTHEIEDSVFSNSYPGPRVHKDDGGRSEHDGGCNVLIAPVSTLMHRLPNKDFISKHSFVMQRGGIIDPQQLAKQLQSNGYHNVSQVMEHGEFSIRGSIVDLFPMGSEHPFRIDLFDNEIDTIRVFDPDSQISVKKIDAINILPAKEYPLDKMGITHFREQWRELFQGDPLISPLYQSISNGISAPGIEYYLPLFFDQTSELFDFLPEETLVCLVDQIHDAAQTFWNEILERHEQLGGDIERPLLPPNNVFIPVNKLFERINTLPCLECKTAKAHTNFPANPEQTVTVHPKSDEPYSELATLINKSDARFLFVAESSGRREVLLDHLRKINLQPKIFENWRDFLDSTERFGITVAPIEQGLTLQNPAISIITESQLFGEKIKQRRRYRSKTQDPEGIIRNLTELNIGSPIVHIEHGIGRYMGLETITTNGITTEFLRLHYAGDHKLFVPVSNLHVISRYTGSENPQLHHLGSTKWQKTKEKAAKRVRDTAVELLDIYARRKAKPGKAMKIIEDEYEQFASSFPFEETADQEKAIANVLNDLSQNTPMDRLVCGDVGFGKTEVAMRAAFICATNNFQVGILVPTTLLCEQHYKNFQDRFANWPIKVAAISRFRSKKEQETIMHEISDGKVDIVIGTHKLLQSSFNFKSLGLLIIDEEHRFGVRQKEKIKSLRAEVDILTLTATPIPRTLNMSMMAIRDLSIIATPPARRLSIITFVRKYNTGIIREAILREILRGGQVYFLHNDVKSITRVAQEIEALVPEAKTNIAHGQMREKDLETVMADFYHRRFNVLVATTIIESGIDVPSANTMIINRADRFGLAQLHQLRGRVGRSHHQAYAYLLTPEEANMTKDAKKRLDAIATLAELGSGFALATNDLEIRGAGEILGDEQSGHIQEIGFSLYMDMLDSAVKALKSGKEPELFKPLHAGPELDLQISALIPDDFIPDIKLRLSLYKRISNAENFDVLSDLRAEMIDRFGFLPEVTENLFKQTHIKLQAKKLGVKKCIISKNFVRLELDEQPNIKVDRLIELVQKDPATYRFEGADKIRYTLSQTDTKAKFSELEVFFEELSA